MAKISDYEVHLLPKADQKVRTPVKTVVRAGSPGEARKQAQAQFPNHQITATRKLD